MPTSRERDTKLNEAIVQGDGVAAADRETGRPDEPCRRSLATTGGADEGRGGGLAGQHHCGSRPATTQAKQHQVSNLSTNEEYGFSWSPMDGKSSKNRGRNIPIEVHVSD